MALNTPNQTTQNDQTQTQQQANASMGAGFGGQQQQSNQSGPKRGSFSFADLGALGRMPMARSPSAEVLVKLTATMQEILKGLDPTYSITLVPIDMQNAPNISLSVLVVALGWANDPKSPIAYHTLILEGSVEPGAITPRYENINGTNVEIVRTAGEAYDRVMIDTVVEWLRKSYPAQQLINADACVVPRSFDVSDQNSVWTLTANAASACSTILEEKHPDFYDVNLANAENDSTLVVRTTFNNPEAQDAVGLPVRADVQIDFSAIVQLKGPQGQQSLNTSLDRSRPISRVTGFMDLVWDPAGPMANAYAQYQQPMGAQMYQRYRPRFVMTNLESVRLLTLPAQLLALVTALTLDEDNAWVGAFQPQPFNSGEIDLHDIGAIGIEANFENNPNGIGSRIDTKSANFRNENLGKLVAATVRQGLILSLDVPECGAQTWYNSPFAAAAEGNAQANQAIVNAANFLTNGAFGRHFPGNGRVTIDEHNRIHLGYYTDRNGVRKDLREIDYLAVLNLQGEVDYEVVRDFSDTFYRIAFPLAQRLQGRKRILSNLVNDLTITGFARRVTFDPAFTQALALACKEVGLSIRTQNPFQEAGTFERATGAYLGSSVLSGAPTGVFNRGFAAAPGQGMSGLHGFGRWGS